MASRFQAASLIASPSYPNSIAWSDENLVAIATGHLVTILNPAIPSGPRGLIVLPSPSRPFSIGIIKKEEMLSDGLLSTCLSHNYRPCVRSISWSPLGLAPNAGCLLAICTSEGQIMIFRQPFREFTAEWVQIMDLSDILEEHILQVNYIEPGYSSNKATSALCTESSRHTNFPALTQEKESKHIEKISMNKHIMAPENEGSNKVYNSDAITAPNLGKSFLIQLEKRVFSTSLLRDHSLVEVFKFEGTKRVWIRGMLKHRSGMTVFVAFPNKNGNYVDRVESTMDHDEIYGSDISDCYSTDLSKIRPCMNTEKLPQEFTRCVGIKEVIISGQSVEAWIKDRWVEGLFICFSEGSLLVKFHGDPDPLLINPNIVRLAPVWVNEESLWHVIVVRLKVETPETLHKPDSGSMEVVDAYPLQIDVKASVEEITPDQYTSRSALMSSLVVSWSPRIQDFETMQDSCEYSLLAVGSKSGKVSLWRVNCPPFYSVGENVSENSVVLVGLFYTHDSWVTSISWTLIYSDLSNPVAVMATGSSDGSVKLWNASAQQLMLSMEDRCTPFSLFHEASPVGSAAVSVISIAVSSKSTNKINLAVGRVSGSFDVWIAEFSPKNISKLGSFNAHHHVITGLVWAFEGTCLYSCSQDNLFRGWILSGNSIIEASIPSISLIVDSSIDVPNVFDSCYGIGVASGNFAVALVRSVDPSVLNPMYQMRTVKAVVEFFLIGASLDNHLEDGGGFLCGFSEKNKDSWTRVLLHSLNRYRPVDGPLVLWDTLAVLLSLKKFAPEFVHSLLSDWLSEGAPEQGRDFSGVPSSRLHLLNVICRHVMLADLDPAGIDITPVEEKWSALLLESELELRARLVSCALRSDKFRVSGQMERWAALNRGRLPRRLVFSAEEPVDSAQRGEEEKCSYCGEGVELEAADVAFCRGLKGGGVHRVERCAVTMGLLDPRQTVWHCVACRRSAARLPPLELFAMNNALPLDQRQSSSSSSIPFCPFCSVLLQRLLPDFLLSVSPV